jgi:hypothetical protein
MIAPHKVTRNVKTQDGCAPRRYRRIRRDEAARGEPLASAPTIFAGQKLAFPAATVAVSTLRAKARSAPTRSETHSTGAEEETAMRSVALDLGVRETSFCEVLHGLVVGRRTVGELKELEDALGPGTRRATVAIEASREHGTSTTFSVDGDTTSCTSTRGNADPVHHDDPRIGPFTRTSRRDVRPQVFPRDLGEDTALCRNAWRPRASRIRATARRRRARAHRCPALEELARMEPNDRAAHHGSQRRSCTPCTVPVLR